MSDLNANGKYDNNDNQIIIYRDTDQNGTILYQQYSFANPLVAPYIVRYTYDAFGRRTAYHTDTDQNGQIDAGETNSKVSFRGDSSAIDVIEVYSGEEFRSLQKLHYSDSNSPIANFYSGADKVYHTLSYNGYGGTVRSSTEDYTEERFHKLFEEIGGTIKTLNMSNANYKTEITLDNNVLAKLTQSELLINGEGTDTINLKDSSEFVKGENVTRGRQQYEQYTTEVDGSTYTLLIDTDINVNTL